MEEFAQGAELAVALAVEFAYLFGGHVPHDATTTMLQPQAKRVVVDGCE